MAYIIENADVACWGWKKLNEHIQNRFGTTMEKWKTKVIANRWNVCVN